jgi:tetratricopeptide (TPR) repeat protein
MSWVDEGPIAIGNFICAALKHGLLQEIFWVVPDATFRDDKGRKPVLQQLKQFQKKYPGSSSIIVEDNRITASVLDKKLTICSLLTLPKPRDAVLLDIDIDYLVIPKVSHAKRDKHGSLPWLWPSDLIKRLHDVGIRSDLVTIAYSVEGGFTPLQWKYLGQELMLRIKDPLGASSDVAGMCRIRQGAEAEQQGQAVIAELKYRQAHELLPNSAAAPYRLARLLLNLGRMEEARKQYGEAVGRDHSYKGAYSSSGFHYYWGGRLAEAEREFQELSTLDPNDAYCQFGLGLLAQKRGRWREAEQRLATALTLDSCLLDAQLALGETLAELGQTSEAIVAYEHALKLELMRHKTLKGPILTDAREKTSLDRRHWATHARLASLYAEVGATAKALNALRLSIAGGLDGARLRFQLARLYLKQRQWSASVPQAWQAIKFTPRAIWARGRRILQRALRTSQS